MNQRLKLTGATVLVFRTSTSLPATRQISLGVRYSDPKLQDFLHWPHPGRRERATFGLEMGDDVFDYLAQIRVDFLRIIPVDPRDKIGAFANVCPILFAPFDPFVILVAFFHS